jgi:ubiquinone/menaquinone biosynthesis C-methylase UbiE
MGHHTFDVSRAESLEDPAARFEYLSREELLWALALEGGETVADLGSGTGFYTDVVAPPAGPVYAVDIQPAMHAFYREKGVPPNVELVTAAVGELPFEDDHLDRALSTMTYHEFVSADAIAELSRVLESDGRLVIADWSAEGSGESGPPLDERETAASATAALGEAGFHIAFEATRPETFLVVAVSDG